jgi:hypothetical protein
VVIANRTVGKGLAKMTSAPRHDVATRVTGLVELLRLNKISSVGQKAMARLGTIAVSVAKVGLALITKAPRPANVARPQVATARAKAPEIAVQVVADRSGINATSRHRAHLEPSALR